MNKLSESLRKSILADAELQGKIAKATLSSPESVKRWARINHKNLLLAPALDAIRSHLKLPKSEVLTEELENAEA